MTNVDEQEIGKFSELASRWWDPEGEFKPLHLINPLRLDFINQHSQGLFDKKVLDIGCGGGILAESMAKAGAQVTGLDMAQASLDVAKLHGLESGVKVSYHCETAENFADAHPAEYDVVTCMEMLEHVPDPASVVKACATLVKPGGHVFFSTLNRNIKSYLMGILGAEYLLKLVPKGTHDHGRFIKPSELIAMTDEANLFPRDMTGLHMDPLSQGFYLSNKNVDVNYLLYTVRGED
ncbi:MAG TPA: bifunctional 2-polyprenyl-6-hydroxyphenol methylase/3-demethylubiquinol 3-O-methyltransferase UbiG [Alteromonas australica]|jgi:2-polyprenyl-6-hydroxyphenyl methylase/3-demethylubiquinone-9 3-methyltransferase|uniref:Ubiquinone biosynthesis O-methyltransferase n=1 Tax=Alteromonas australica TaxID=589873 RepID=A0A353JL60_9ALTE|nr:bifunctional 2-polyprenyl-6-hydroxyphenol methylase/3-demethylubiquinol 3-O-methyltransferase UbiG [Alteromonas australica]MAF71984.1 bifunctional 2-polyprenyl-6-hydroxyphenol methylase/3-demethylubiquinol 3-O-methyltransferase UbiG [Alteromonas sp.]AJP44146.1 3-demethylubiquinone-9 3-methyltransferase [Alteromonas australica]MBU33474.1 bifunctional 2-polyprenyl-6-hydroxyphenol methylase/3-demethylubiquinol 3-O-methyltransferase UbiG [Alteromonas sp.]HAI73602.1 bifunctional 2-polyprenyl-6-hy|tara:strand:- start:4866 stop:5573 length:708 start_codon:yes stop_codon:yes gene_type:complete